LLKVALNTINQTKPTQFCALSWCHRTKKFSAKRKAYVTSLREVMSKYHNNEFKLSFIQRKLISRK
jgi:hypothetical protein